MEESKVFFAGKQKTVSAVVLPLSEGFDVEDGSAVDHVQALDGNDVFPDSLHGQHRHSDGVGPEGRTDAEHTFFGPGRVSPGMLGKVFGGKRPAAVKVKDDDDPLTRSNIPHSPDILFIDEQLALHLRNGPGVGHLCGLGMHRPDGLELNHRCRPKF